MAGGFYGFICLFLRWNGNFVAGRFYEIFLLENLRKHSILFLLFLRGFIYKFSFNFNIMKKKPPGSKTNII